MGLAERFTKGVPKEEMIKSNVHITPQLRSRISSEFLYELDRKVRSVIKLFPELDADRIEIGLTRAMFFSAIARTKLKDRIKIAINPLYPVTYFTLGHELTHFAQHLDGDKKEIPYGEVQSDVWTIARNELFLDSPPSYLKVPKHIYDNWSECSKHVRELCIQAIEIRKTKREYLKWLESQLTVLWKRL
ncbi:MAG: hypothetical protein U9N61_00050 [Euryarchaeota archaeon]|nr:hypothetical protein [Euryarchaeota archaeon]